MKKTQNTPLIFALIIAALLVSGSLIFLGVKMSSGGTGDLDTAIQQGIENYIQKSQSAQQTGTRKAEKVDNDIEDDDPVLGDKDAQVMIVEFSDYECPFCKRNFTQTYPSMKSKYFDTGKVKLVYRDFPLGFHDPLATQEAIAAECVREQSDDEKYFAYHDLVFQTTNSNGQGMPKEKLYNLAGQVGVNVSKFTDCLDSEEFKDEIKDDIAAGQKAGISGTPGFIILGPMDSKKIELLKAEEIVQQGEYIVQYIESANGKRMGMRVSGAQDFALFEKILEILLTKK